MSMIKKMAKGLTSRRMVSGLLRGAGGAVLAGIGWKLGSDIYDAVKKRLQERSAGAQPDSAQEGGGERQDEA